MAATIYLLAINQQKQDILREEVMSSDGKKTYLKACIKESMRMMPVSAANARETSKEYNVLGYRIPKGVNNQYVSILLTCQPHVTISLKSSQIVLLSRLDHIVFLSSLN